MKVFVILFLTLIQTGHSIAQYNTLNDSIINSNYLNFATLVVDYDTYEFEGGNLSYYQHCENCTEDSIPFEIIVNYPGDFGDITFLIQNTWETTFFASIIWMGTGEIYHPDTFSFSFPFNTINNQVEIPNNIEYYDIYGTKVYNDSLFIQSANAAWNTVDSLEITKVFSENNYKVAIYLYPPSVGVFNPAAAKWIIFFYLNDFNAAVAASKTYNRNQLSIYPNPCKDYLTFEIAPYNSDAFDVEILDLSGRCLLKKQNHSIETGKINVSFLGKGTYILRMHNSQSRYISFFVKN